MRSSQKQRQETQTSPPIQHDEEEFNWEKIYEGAQNMLRLSEVMLECEEDEKHRLRKLKEFPKGYHLEGTYQCAICRQYVSTEENWFDQHGIKCMICQGAIDRGEIPASCASDKESWYDQWDIESKFNVNRHVLKRWVKAGILKARTVTTNNGKGVRAQLFLIEDNKDTLPPKELVESQLVDEVRDGKVWSHSEPWYRFVDPHKHLKGYKIMQYLQATSTEETKKP